MNRTSNSEVIFARVQRRAARRSFLPWAAAAWLAASIPASAADNLNPSSVQTVKQFKFERTRKAEVSYLLFLPKGCESKSGKRWPLILFLHGAGERGTNVWKVAVHGPPKLVAQQPDFPFIVVSPQCPEGRIWSNDVLLGLLDEVVRQYPVDPGRVYLTGLSMGGYGTWSLGLRLPGTLCGYCPDLRRRRFAHHPAGQPAARARGGPQDPGRLGLPRGQRPGRPSPGIRAHGGFPRTPACRRSN